MVYYLAIPYFGYLYFSRFSTVHSKMKPKPRQRYRICGTPVRTGCVTCKIRRVKCDETKPFCKRCTATDRQCDGYILMDQLSNRRHGPSSTGLGRPQDPLEQRFLQFFVSVTAPALFRDFSKDFWMRTVPAASNTEPCVRHVVIAVGALHQRFVSIQQFPFIDEDTSFESFAFQQYYIAIGLLQKLMSTQTHQMDITLLCCILFTYFDCLSGNHDGAIIHLKSGLRILDNTAVSLVRAAIGLEWEKVFAPLLLALGVQAATFVNPEYRKYRESLWNMMEQARLIPIPQTFSSLDEARHALETLTTDIMSDRTAEKEDVF
ncbi:hypothetical protein BJ878DRAFT_77548 [Calycina marina]|uniref:Zn(2)-C6 fungal-type domain-containing protein n=1 Tax=Calycina marina TaxID=1763456 RepID=A0A9P7Z9S1_9HELO|nr:hypothetical protein BJ878DRAFT_77548 [Calycina marina]